MSATGRRGSVCDRLPGHSHGEHGQHAVAYDERGSGRTRPVRFDPYPGQNEHDACETADYRGVDRPRAPELPVRERCSHGHEDKRCKRREEEARDDSRAAPHGLLVSERAKHGARGNGCAYSDRRADDLAAPVPPSLQSSRRCHREAHYGEWIPAVGPLR